MKKINIWKWWNYIGSRRQTWVFQTWSSPLVHGKWLSPFYRLRQFPSGKGEDSEYNLIQTEYLLWGGQSRLSLHNTVTVKEVTRPICIKFRAHVAYHRNVLFILKKNKKEILTPYQTCSGIKTGAKKCELRDSNARGRTHDGRNVYYLNVTP